MRAPFSVLIIALATTTAGCTETPSEPEAPPPAAESDGGEQTPEVEQASSIEPKPKPKLSYAKITSKLDQQLSPKAAAKLKSDLAGAKKLDPTKALSKGAWKKAGAPLDRQTYTKAPGGYLPTYIGIASSKDPLIAKYEGKGKLHGVARPAYERAERALTAEQGKTPSKAEVIAYIKKQDADVKRLNDELRANDAKIRAMYDKQDTAGLEALERTLVYKHIHKQAPPPDPLAHLSAEQRKDVQERKFAAVLDKVAAEGKVKGGSK